jgi:hypothetical protein
MQSVEANEDADIPEPDFNQPTRIRQSEQTTYYNPFNEKI